MDQGPQAPTGDRLILSGIGQAASACDPTPFLLSRKSRKYMGVQDELAVAAAGAALESAGLLGRSLGRRMGLFMAVGYIPFEKDDIDRLMDASCDHRGLTMERFSTFGLEAVSPLLTFRCLSNMPAYHISVNFDVRGAYLVTYPGVGQFYTALEEARAAIDSGKIDAALVGAVAHQKNFLVAHHYSRLTPPVQESALVDSGAFLVLESPEAARRRDAPVRGRLLDFAATYRPHKPFEDVLRVSEVFEGGAGEIGECGPCSLPLALAKAGPGLFRHHVETRDGIQANSSWELCDVA